MSGDALLHLLLSVLEKAPYSLYYKSVCVKSEFCKGTWKKSIRLLDIVRCGQVLPQHDDRFYLLMFDCCLAVFMDCFCSVKQLQENCTKDFI